MKITPRVASELLRHEGLVTQAYKDAVGVWTWSVGITSMSGHQVERYIDNPQTIEKCLQVYLWVLEKYADKVRSVFKDYPLTEQQFAAALSFHYNTGRIGSASWVKLFKAGKTAQARASFMQWSKAGGRTLPALVRRREEEWDLLSRGIWHGDGKVTVYNTLSNHRINWGTAKRIDVSNVLNRLLKETNSWPSSESSPPSSVEEPSRQSPGLWQVLLRLLRRWFSTSS